MPSACRAPSTSAIQKLTDLRGATVQELPEIFDGKREVAGLIHVRQAVIQLGDLLKSRQLAEQARRIAEGRDRLRNVGSLRLQLLPLGLEGDDAIDGAFGLFPELAQPLLMNFVFTVCNNAANEVCPVWPGQPITAHWGVPNPAAVSGTPQEIERAFSQTFSILERRIPPDAFAASCQPGRDGLEE